LKKLIQETLLLPDAKTRLIKRLQEELISPIADKQPNNYNYLNINQFPK